MKSFAPATKAFLALVIALLALAVTAQAAPAKSTNSKAAANPRTALLKEMNAARRAHGLRPLKLNATLTRPAIAHSRHLARTGELDHNGADGKPFWVRIHKAGYSKRKAVGENLGMIGGCATREGKLMVQMWLESPTHRRNLLAKDFRNVGIAIVTARDCSNTVYATDFGG